MTAATSAESLDRKRSVPLGMLLAVLGLSIFGLQDVLTKVLVSGYPIAQFLMVRYWAFTVFAVVYAQMHGGLRAAIASRRPLLQVTRGMMLVIDMALFCLALRFIGLADLHAIYAVAPLMTTMLVGPMLGEQVGWRRRTAVVVGFVGALVILRPGLGVVHWAAFIVLAAALTWAFYMIITRMVSRTDSFQTSTLYTAICGALSFTPFGILQWQWPDAMGWTILAAVSTTGIIGHMVYIKALEHAPAIVLQPFTYLLLVWATFYGFVVFGDLPDQWTILGAIIVVASGLYVTWREWVRSREAGAALAK